jgi:hypothetical protein
MVLAVAAAIVAGRADALDEVRQERVQFEPGASSAVIAGEITGYEGIDYLLGARAGQTMRVTMTTDHAASYFNVIPPDSENEAVFVGSTEGADYEGRLDLDGDWKIRVYLMRSAARRGETARFTLEVGIHGSPDSSYARGANDFGPREWDARGKLGCAFGGEPMRPSSCQFKVIRYPSGRTLFVENPADEAVRILYFDNGEWSTDSAETVEVTQRADMWTLTVGGDEAYEFPDAVLTGG